MCDKMDGMIYAIGSAVVLVFVLLIGSTIESFRVKNTVSRALGNFEFVAILSLLFCSLLYVMPNEFLSRLMLGLYCFSLDFSLFALLNYVTSFDNVENDTLNIRLVQYWCGFLTLIDAIFLISSAFTGLCFNVSPYTLKNGFNTWVITFNIPITFHLGLCYSLSAVLFVKNIKAVFQSAAFYRPRFVLVLILFTVEFLTNLIFMIAPEYWIFDFSSLFYGILVIVCFAVTVYSVPSIIKKRIVGIASESVSDAVICFDYKGKPIYINETAKRFFNADNDEWVISFINSDTDYLIKTINITVQENVHTCKVEYRRFYDKHGKHLGSYIKMNDYTEEVNKIKQEEYRASHDSLTGLFNREAFFKEAQKVISAEPLVPRYMVSTDIKNFKMFNDYFGVKFGDSILKTQAEMLRQANYDGVVLGRVSGDKFAMLINQRNFKPELAMKNSYRIKEITKDIDFPLTLMIGVYEIKDSNENVRSMYDKAYMAIKNNINEGFANLAYYDSSLMDKLMEEKNIVSRFDNAINTNQFVFYLQSQINSVTGECEGAEALVRWNYPEKGILPPGAYINILEKSGQIYKLDQYIWEQVVKLLKDWDSRGIDKYISINVSVKDFYYIDLYEVLTGLVEKYKVSPSKLNIEITESVVSSNDNAHKEILCKLQDYGFKIEMDDFGSGYSSLNLLKDISMDVLKIDMGFLEKTENADRAIMIINSITKMAKNLGMKIIAEGVETESQTDILVRANVDLFQGYLYSKPISVEEFEEKYLGVKK